MLEKEMVKFVKALVKFHVWLARTALSKFAFGFRVLAIIALVVSMRFVLDYGTHHPFTWFAFLTVGIGFSWALIIGGVDIVWKSIHLPPIR